MLIVAQWARARSHDHAEAQKVVHRSSSKWLGSVRSSGPLRPVMNSSSALVQWRQRSTRIVYGPLFPGRIDCIPSQLTFGDEVRILASYGVAAPRILGKLQRSRI